MDREVDFLVLGAGWTSTFLIPQLQSQKIKYAATSTSGREGTVKFVFDPDSPDLRPFQLLPHARTILITFPLKGRGPSKVLLGRYLKTHPSQLVNWIQLGSTGIYTTQQWTDRDSKYDKSNQRAIAEDELLDLGGVVLNLAGLYGGSRNPKNWVTKVAGTKEQLKTKKALHLIHGEDVARAIIATHRKFNAGERWIITDLQIYDWYWLVYRWADDVQKDNKEKHLPYRQWVLELMGEERVKALPREPHDLGRCLDSRAFWKDKAVLPQEILN